MQDPDNQHFNKLFLFCCIFAGTGIVFLMALCFLSVPKEGVRFADNVQGFIEGSVVTACLQFLLGGNMPIKKSSEPTVVQTGSDPVTNVSPTEDEKTT